MLGSECSAQGFITPYSLVKSQWLRAGTSKGIYTEGLFSEVGLSRCLATLWSTGLRTGKCSANGVMV